MKLRNGRIVREGLKTSLTESRLRKSYSSARKRWDAVCDSSVKKLLVSLAMERKFATEGPQAIDEGDDILVAMARELVMEKGIGENADAVWKQLQRQQAEVLGVRAVETSPAEAEPPERDTPEVLIQPPAPIPAVVTQLLMFGISLDSVPRRKASRRPSSTATTSDQLGWFRS